MGKFDLAVNIFNKTTQAGRFVTKPVKVSVNEISGLKYAPELSSDVTSFSRIRKILSKEEALTMKPKEFTTLLEKRVDISSKVKEGITSPERLHLYDEFTALEEIKTLPLEKRSAVLEELFSAYALKTTETSALIEVLPKLIKKGYKPELLAKLPITNANKNQVEYVLSRTDLPEKALAKRIENLRNEWRYNPSGLEGTISFWKKQFKPEKEFAEMIKYVNDKNVKYLDDCIELTGHASDLAYWGKDTSKIIKEFGNVEGLLDRLFRRGHSYESVKKILGEEKITSLNARLLEFKNYDKYKDIGLEEYKNLSTKEKKDFLNGFVSAITPKEAAFRHQHELENNFEYLQSKMKIFKELNPETKESFISSYQNTIRKMLEEIPVSERTTIRKMTDTKSYLREYRTANPIPTLVDDISQVLPVKEVMVNGRKIKVAQMDRETAMGIATHRMPNDEAILNIEALEITDPNMLLCIGQKAGNRGLNYADSGAALIVKPRYGNDWHVQAYGDIDSGNNASKNIFNFENVMLPSIGNHCEAIDLVPNLIKKELNLSQIEYTARMKAVKDAATLQEIGKIDPVLEKAIRKIIAENTMYEGLIKPEVMGVAVNSTIPLEKISPDLLSYCERRGAWLVQIKPVVK